LVSKEALGPQLYNQWVRFGLTICYKMRKKSNRIYHIYHISIGLKLSQFCTSN
jgi:hypothetical protein